MRAAKATCHAAGRRVACRLTLQLLLLTAIPFMTLLLAPYKGRMPATSKFAEFGDASHEHQLIVTLEPTGPHRYNVLHGIPGWRDKVRSPS